MAEPDTFLRIEFGGARFLLPGNTSYTIETREGMTLNRDASPVCAWRTVDRERLPAYCLDAELKPIRRDDWQRAVFIETHPKAIGLIVDDVQVMPKVENAVTGFTPLGPAPIPAGHLFGGAWVDEGVALLVFIPANLVAYLQSLGIES